MRAKRRIRESFGQQKPNTTEPGEGSGWPAVGGGHHLGCGRSIFHSQLDTPCTHKFVGVREDVGPWKFEIGTRSRIVQRPRRRRAAVFPEAASDWALRLASRSTDPRNAERSASNRCAMRGNTRRWNESTARRGPDLPSWRDSRRRGDRWLRTTSGRDVRCSGPSARCSDYDKRVSYQSMK